MNQYSYANATSLGAMTASEMERAKRVSRLGEGIGGLVSAGRRLEAAIQELASRLEPIMTIVATSEQAQGLREPTKLQSVIAAQIQGETDHLVDLEKKVALLIEQIDL